MDLHYRLTRAPLVALVALAACKGSSSAAAPSAKDPNAPALAPAVIDTRPKEEKADPKAVAKGAHKSPIPQDPADQRAHVDRDYSLGVAFMVFHDASRLASMYSANATLRYGDSTITGQMPIATSLTGSARAKGMAEMSRTGVALKVVDDSTLSDSGRYMMTFVRGKDTTYEHGTYVARWRAFEHPKPWMILEDHLVPLGSRNADTKAK